MSFESPLPPFNASDPSATFLNSSCLDLLMIELVPMAYRIVNEVDGDAAQIQRDDASLSVKGPAGGVNGSVNGKKMDEDEERDAVFFRLEMLGYRVGQGLVERYVVLQFLEFRGLGFERIAGGLRECWKRRCKGESSKLCNI
jgi:hypothetical protein